MTAQALEDHFSRAWDMVRDAVSAFPDEAWREASDARMQPARIVYHILIAADRYTWTGGADDFLPQRKFGLNWVEASVSDFPSRERALEQIEHAKEATLRWIRSIDGSGLISEKATWSWTGENALAQGLFHLRHTQHHMAELNVELRRRGLPTVAWK